MPYPVLRVCLVLALLGGAWGAISKSMPYTGPFDGAPGKKPGIDCYDEAILKANTGLGDDAIKLCGLACKRVKDTVAAQASRGCEETATYVYELMKYLDGSATITNAHKVGEIVHKLVHDKESSCLHDLEGHLQNREKHCTFTADLGTFDKLPAESKTQYMDQTVYSARRRFALEYMHHHLTQAKQKDFNPALLYENIYCFPVAVEATYKMAAALPIFGGGSECKKDARFEKWQKEDCTLKCWNQIKAAVDASMVNGGAHCCLANYYSSFMAFTYGRNFPLGTHFVDDKDRKPGCSVDSVPCTSVSDVLKLCADQHDLKGWDDIDKYKPDYCASASSLTKSFLVMAAGVLSAASLIFWS